MNKGSYLSKCYQTNFNGNDDPLQEIRLLVKNKVANNILKVVAKWFSDNILVAMVLCCH